MEVKDLNEAALEGQSGNENVTDSTSSGQESAKMEEVENENVVTKVDELAKPAVNDIDLNLLDKEQLLVVLENLLTEEKPVVSLRDNVEAIKISFYKKHKSEIDQKRKRFMQEGGDAELFEPGEDALEVRFKELYKRYRHMKAAHNRSLDDVKKQNLEAKLQVVEDLKALVNSNEDINLTFPEFRKLQKRWREIGMVPQQNVRDLWDTYHHFVETFYDHIKINKDLRDLDLRKNLEAKIELCEKSEELLLESSILAAFRKLQKYHELWRETGPVSRDQKDVIWERFREVTHKINKKHQDYFDNLKDTQKRNLELKTALCEKAESLKDIKFESLNEVDRLTKEMIGLQKTWKTIGFAPKKDNNKIYQRFRTACDLFFARKKEFNSQNKDELNLNLQKKIDLCEKAEDIKDSSDWKSVTDELIQLQKEWKLIGPVSRSHYDPVWKRFRAACDQFFNRKSKHFAAVDSEYDENLKLKRSLIERIENFVPGKSNEENLSALKEFQREWVSIGFVPIKKKEKIQQRYRKALDKHFEGIKLDDSKKNLIKFKSRLVETKDKPRSDKRIRFEREKFLNKYKQLENDITIWENNIGFFAKSKSAEATIKEFQEKIDKGKEQMNLLEEKIRIIDEMDNE